MAVTIDEVGTLVAAEDTGPLSPTYPAGILSGHLAVAIVGARDNHTDIDCNTAGWVEAGPQPQELVNLQVRMSVWVAAYTAGQALPEFVGVDGGGVNPANGLYGIIARASGHDTSTPVDVFGSGAAGDSQTMTGAGITTATAGALVGVAYISSNDVAHLTPGNGGALRTNQLSVVGSQAAVSLVTATRGAAGATGAYTLEQATSARYQWAAVTFALRAAPTAVPSRPVDARRRRLRPILVR